MREYITLGSIKSDILAKLHEQTVALHKLDTFQRNMGASLERQRILLKIQALIQTEDTETNELRLKILLSVIDAIMTD